MMQKFLRKFADFSSEITTRKALATQATSHHLLCQTLPEHLEHIRASVGEDFPEYPTVNRKPDDEVIDKVYHHMHPNMHSFLAECQLGGMYSLSSTIFTGIGLR
jgi:hypothetical protein